MGSWVESRCGLIQGGLAHKPVRGGGPSFVPLYQLWGGRLCDFPGEVAPISQRQLAGRAAVSKSSQHS